MRRSPIGRCCCARLDANGLWLVIEITGLPYPAPDGMRTPARVVGANLPEAEARLLSERLNIERGFGEGTA